MQSSALLIVLLAVAAPSLAAPQAPSAAVSTAPFDKEINELLAVVPLRKLANIVVDYMAGDDEVKAFVNFVKSDDFKSIVRKLDTFPELSNMLSYLESVGLPAYKHANAIHTALGVESVFLPATPISADAAPGMAGLVNALREAVPMSQIADLYIQGSEQLMTVVDRIRGDDLTAIIEKLEDLPEVKEAQKRGYLVPIARL